MAGYPPLRDILGLAFVSVVIVVMMLTFRKIFPDASRAEEATPKDGDDEQKPGRAGR